MNEPEAIIVHHTGGTKADPLADTSHHTFETVKNYHISKGWGNIGYHWFIEKSGKIFKGREETQYGAHTIGMNDKSIGICLAGNFDTTLPTEAQEKSLITMYETLVKRYPVLENKIFPHRKFANRTCYGKNLADNWAQELVKKEELVTPSAPEEPVTPQPIINNNIYMDKFKEILTSSRMKSFYWRTGMMMVSVLLTSFISIIDMFSAVLNPVFVTMLGLVLGEVSKAINNSLQTRK